MAHCRMYLIEKLHELRLHLTYSNGPNKETPSNDNLSHNYVDTRRKGVIEVEDIARSQVLIKPIKSL